MTKKHLRKEWLAPCLDPRFRKSRDAECLKCGFEMVGGAVVGLCPRCGSSQWYRTRLPEAVF